MSRTNPNTYSHANGHTESNGYYSADDHLEPISIIEVQSNPKKRIWLKVISSFVSMVFLMQQVGFADSYSYKRLGGVAEELLPSSSEYDQNNRFAPAYLQRQQQKHEDIVRQRMGKDELMEQLVRKPRRQEEETPLKKKKGTAGGGNAEYTLTDSDEMDDPHNYNDLEYDANQLDSINTFDITKYPYVNVDQWKSESEKKPDEKTGLDYWVGFSDEKTPGDERLIKYAVYPGDAEKE
ncbi:MAG: hypothetical protein PHT95_03715, partial [Candidatus Omnitrophica bacterium]|nr:hypothetical protein [Candidatus Omnitrophota bacterium]